jgi:cell division protein FtsL
VSALAQPAGVDAHPARKRKRTRVRLRRRVDRGVLWITGLAVLLAGVVAVNVAVLQLNVRLDELGRERVELQGETKRLSSQLSSASATARIEAQAKSKLGLVQADPELTYHVQLPPPGQ